MRTLRKSLIALLFGLVIIVILISAFWYFEANSPKSTPTATPTPTAIISPTLTPTPTSIPIATVTAQINATQNNLNSPNSGGNYLLINGTITNNSPNEAYEVGLNVTASEHLPPPSVGVAVNMIIPVSSGTYIQVTPDRVQANNSSTTVSNQLPLESLAPYQTVYVEIKIYPIGQSQTPTLYNTNVNLLWSNMP